MKKTYMGLYSVRGIWGKLLVGARNFAEAQQKVMDALGSKEYDMECCLITPIIERK